MGTGLHIRNTVRRSFSVILMCRKIYNALFIGDVTGPSKTLRRASGYDKVDEQTDRHDRAEDKTEYHE